MRLHFIDLCGTNCMISGAIEGDAQRVEECCFDSTQLPGIVFCWCWHVRRRQRRALFTRFILNSGTKKIRPLANHFCKHLVTKAVNLIPLTSIWLICARLYIPDNGLRRAPAYLLVSGISQYSSCSFWLPIYLAASIIALAAVLIYFPPFLSSCIYVCRPKCSLSRRCQYYRWN